LNPALPKSNGGCGMKRKMLSIILILVMVISYVQISFAEEIDTEEMKESVSEEPQETEELLTEIENESTAEGAEHDYPQEVQDAGFTYEQYMAILEMPDFPNSEHVMQFRATTATSTQQAVVDKALSYLGVPYLWGGTSPSGFDCSGLVQYVYKHAAGITLPRVTTGQESCGQEVSLNALQPGDLLFFGTRGSTYHVAIYIGNNQFVHAPKPGDVVKVTNMAYFYPSFARRILPSTIAVTSVKLNKTAIGVLVGGSEILTVTVSPSDATNKSITWSSGNGAIATVDSNGKVTARSVGTTTITAKNASSGLSASCVVKVRGDIEGFVRRLYTEGLGRQPDATGLNAYTKSLIADNITAAKVVEEFFTGSEYTSKKATDEQFVNAAYKAILGRNADASGKENMLKALNFGASRKYVLFQMIYSAEFTKQCEKLNVTRGNITLTEARDKNIKVTEFVYYLYVNGLGRKPDTGGLNAYTNSLNNGGSAASVVRAIFTSTEYTNRKRSNSDFVEDLYKTLLQRASDSAGKRDWVNKLNAGTSRLDVIKGFINSGEFTNICTKYGITKGSL